MNYHVRLLTRSDLDAANQIDMSYASASIYKLTCQLQDEVVTFTLIPVSLERPIEITYDWDWADAPGFLEHLHSGQVWGAFTAADADAATSKLHRGRPRHLSLPQDEGPTCLGLIELDYATEGNAITIESLFVHRPWRGKGVGRALLAAGAAWAEAQGARALLTVTQTGNMPAIMFYRSMGFTICGAHELYYSNTGSESGEAAIFLAKQLGGRAE